MKTPPSQSQNGGVAGSTSISLRNGDSRSSLKTSSSGNYINGGAPKMGIKQQLVSLNGDSICCNSIEHDEALACDIAPLPSSGNKAKSKALCVHIRENKWYDGGNVVSVAAAGASLNEALESMSLAYSPATKQLYSLDELADNSGDKDELLLQQCSGGDDSPRNSLPRSCSSTVSSLSECSASNGFLGSSSTAEEPSSPGRSRLWPLSLRSVFSWGSSGNSRGDPEQQQQQQPTSPSRNSDKIGGSLALIQQQRPAHLPAKTPSEEESHRRQYSAILEAARRRERREELERRQQRELQLREEERLAEDSAAWTGQVLPRFEALRETRRVRELWWRGLPPSVRGRVWRLAVGNPLNLTGQLYRLCLERALAGGAGCGEHLAAIRLDVARTFPTLCVFQEGGPLSASLQGVLAAYAVYRPDIGYVQGMSFVGAMLALNMDAEEAFTCFANLLNRPCHLAAFSLDQRQMGVYYRAYSAALGARLPKLHAHFLAAGLSPDLYLLDWLYTIYAKSMPLDVASRVWDVFLRDGDEFLFRTALGVLHLYQEELLGMDFVRAAQFLTRLPEGMQADALFASIGQMSTMVGPMSFQQMIAQFSALA